MPLSFFTNSGGSYGSALPFQRIVEPAQLGFFLNLEQAELLRIQRYNEGWRFYFGKHWLFKQESGDPLVTFNYFRKIIDKATEFLVAKGFTITTPDSLDEITRPFLDEVWKYNKREQLAWDCATTGGVTGDVFILITYEEPSIMQRKVNPYSEGHIRVNLLGSEQVYPTWDPLNTDTLTAVRIETVYYAERGTRQLDRDDKVNHEGRNLNTKRFTQIITRDQIVEQFHGDMPMVRPNALGEIPIVHIKNVSIPKEYYGISDGQDLVDVQRELNEKATDVSDIINYHAAPITAVFGAKAKQLDRGPRNLWSGLPKDSRIETISMPGDLAAADKYIDRVKKVMHELSDVPEGALGAMQPISNTSGVALHIQYQPLIGKTKKKRVQYEPGFEQVNYFMLRIGQTKGLISLPFDLCKNCGGRVVKIDKGKMTRVWDPRVQNFVVVPVTEKRCYHIDHETLEFRNPFDMRLKWWRQYGFGSEIREMPLRKIIDEISQQKTSFWDFTVFQKQVADQWRQQNAGAMQAAHAAGVANMTPPEQPATPEGMQAPEPAPHIPPTPQALIPQVVVEPPKIEMPPMLRVIPLPDGEIDVPEEPEEVTITQEWVHPETQQVMARETSTHFLVPTGCKRPQYLNPFETKVTFNDVLPKDEALQAQLYGQYQQNGWVDAEWVQDRIPEIAANKLEIRKRMKAVTELTRRMKPAMVQQTAGSALQPEAITYQGDLAPGIEPQAAVPGPGGNPVMINNQLPPPGAPQT